MKILLIRPAFENIASKVNVVNVEPLELEYLYTVAKEEGCECKIHDVVVDKSNIDNAIRQYAPAIVGITGYITHIELMLEYAKKTKMFFPNAKVIIGGVHAEINYKQFYNQNVDFIAHSGGVQPFRNIIKKLRDHLDDFKDISGICYKDKSDCWIYNEFEPINPDLIPIPDRTFFYKNKQHFKYINYKPCAVLKASYSCPHNCNFCYCTKLNGGKYVYRSVEKVVEEIEGIDCEYIWIIDDTFYVDKEKIYKFIKLIREKKIDKKYMIYYRADFVAGNEEIMAELRRIGVIIVLVGLEAFDDAVLGSYNKGSTLQINTRCLEVLEKNDIACTGLFIVDINATLKDFKVLNNYIKKCKLKLVTAAILTPLPGTEQYEKYKDELITNNPRRWDFMHLVVSPANMSRGRFYFEYYKLYVRIAMVNRKNGLLDEGYIKVILKVAREFIKEALHIKDRGKMNERL